MPPTREQIRTAAAAAAREFGGEQVILFGSQARGTAGPHSDVDLLVLKHAKDGTVPNDLTELNRDSAIGRLLGGTPVHILLMDRDQAEDARGRPGVLGGAAVEQGVTVYCDGATDPLKTGARYWRMPGGAMVKMTKFRPREAERLARRARKFLKYAEAERKDDASDACILLQKAAEHMLKALITAKGEQFEHTHDLNKLWDAAGAAGIKIDAPRDRDALKELTKYAASLEYSEDPADRPAAETLKKTLKSTRGIVAQGGRDLPGHMDETIARLTKTAQRAVGTTEPRRATKYTNRAPPE